MVVAGHQKNGYWMMLGHALSEQTVEARLMDAGNKGGYLKNLLRPKWVQNCYYYIMNCLYLP